MIVWLLLCVAVIGGMRRVDLFQSFSEGAEHGLKTAFRILPFLAATLTALRVAEGSGLLEAICAAAAPVSEKLGLPSGCVPLLIFRPLSGSASLALLDGILRRYGPDSRTGLVASAMMGSGETVLYTCAVYLSAAGIRKSRYIIPVSLAGWLAGCVTAGLFFR